MSVPKEWSDSVIPKRSQGFTLQQPSPAIEKAHFDRVMILKVVVAFCVCFQYPLLILTQSLKNFIVNKNLYIEVI